VNEEWLSAHLDGELSGDQARELERALATDRQLAEVLEGLGRVRSMLRVDVEIPAGAIERVVLAVEADDERAQVETVEAAAPVVSLTTRRRIPSFAAVAAVVAIIASVVGGLGGSTTVPALGELIARHEVAAAVIEGEPMPDGMDDMDPMPMSDATQAALPMPADYSMENAFVDGGTIHLLYRTRLGEPVSVFRQEGDVDMTALGDGSMVHGDEADMWTAPMYGAYVAVVDGDGYLWVVVSPAPHDDMMDGLMHDLPTRAPAVTERLRDAADAVVEPFRIWD
jgi:hypothetical protein